MKWKMVTSSDIKIMGQKVKKKAHEGATFDIIGVIFLKSNIVTTIFTSSVPCQP